MVGRWWAPSPRHGASAGATAECAAVGPAGLLARCSPLGHGIRAGERVVDFNIALSFTLGCRCADGGAELAVVSRGDWRGGDWRGGDDNRGDAHYGRCDKALEASSHGRPSLEYSLDTYAQLPLPPSVCLPAPELADCSFPARSANPKGRAVQGQPSLPSVSRCHHILTVVQGYNNGCWPSTP